MLDLIDEFFNDPEICEPGTIAGIATTGIFDETGIDPFALGESGTENRRITYRVKSSVAAPVHHGDVVVVRGRSFRVDYLEPLTDGQTTNLHLVD